MQKVPVCTHIPTTGRERIADPVHVSSSRVMVLGTRPEVEAAVPRISRILSTFSAGMSVLTCPQYLRPLTFAVVGWPLFCRLCCPSSPPTVLAAYSGDSCSINCSKMTSARMRMKFSLYSNFAKGIWKEFEWKWNFSFIQILRREFKRINSTEFQQGYPGRSLPI